MIGRVGPAPDGNPLLGGRFRTIFFGNGDVDLFSCEPLVAVVGKVGAELKNPALLGLRALIHTRLPKPDALAAVGNLLIEGDVVKEPPDAVKPTEALLCKFGDLFGKKESLVPNAVLDVKIMRSRPERGNSSPKAKKLAEQNVARARRPMYFGRIVRFPQRGPRDRGFARVGRAAAVAGINPILCDQGLLRHI